MRILIGLATAALLVLIILGFFVYRFIRRRRDRRRANQPK